jgi:ATP-dependent helicase/nuclease subunit B
MTVFLKKVANYLFENHKDDLSEICVVFPNRRAGLYLKKFLSENYNKTLWLPQIFAIEDFIEELAPISSIDNFALIFEIYKIHCEIENVDAKTFDEFLSLGDILLHDFNEIDLYLADAKSLFSYLTESKAISIWNLDGNELTNFQKKYLKFYNSLFDYYLKLNKNLLDQQIGYQGMLYRYVAENITVIVENIKWKKIVFAGFNALTSSEESIILSLKKQGIATVLWDSDSYYVDNEIQEAGKFIRTYKNEWLDSKYLWKEESFKTTSKSINLIGVPMKLGQAKYAGNIASDILKNQGSVDDTAIVLCDENLLFPVLNAIPSEIKSFNLTMGLPFKSTMLYNLVDCVLLLHENKQRLSNIEKGRNGFYFKDIINILDNSYLKIYFNFDIIVKDIKKSNRVFYYYEDIINKYFQNNELEIRFLSCIFNNWQNDKDIVFQLKIFLQIFRQSIVNEDEKLVEKEIIFHFAKLLQKLSQISEKKTEELKVSTFRKLFKRIIANQSIPLYGEPLEGMQVMGMLETRTLDFKNVVLLSVNEGILPASRSFNSFVPIDIKKLFGLPDYSDKDAIFAYHFYRLLQRAENINILYNTEPDEFSDGDKSRFIYQIINELPKYNSNIKIKEYVLNVTSEIKQEKQEIIIQKDSFVYKRLNEIAVKGFSASKLNDYINCSLQFYYKHIAEIAEPDETEEVIQANTLGSVIHEVLSELYNPFVGKVLQIESVKRLLLNVDEITDKHFEKQYKDGDVSFGINLLTVKMAKMYIRNMLNNEIGNVSQLATENLYLSIKMLEEKLECVIDCDLEGIPFIKLIGFVDRIDIVGDKIRIVDYKTGKVEQSNLKLTNPDLLITDNKYSKCLQLLVYALLYAKENPDYGQSLIAGILSMRNQMKGFISLIYNGKDELDSDEIIQFEKILISLFKEIFDVNTPFYQTKTLDNCKYCVYKEICGR